MYSSKQISQVNKSLENILHSDGFTSAPQLRNFLEFVVSKTLNLQADEIKGYTIGVDALGRPADFDPTTDPVVRVMAGRLRQALKNYQTENSNNNDVVISIAKGSYVPQFDFDKSKAATLDIAKSKLDVAQTSQSKSKSFITPILAIAAIVIAGFALWKTSLPSITQAPVSSIRNTIDPYATRISLSLRTNEDPIPKWFSTQEAEAGLVTAFSRFNEYITYQVPWSDWRIGSHNIFADYHFSVLITRAGSSKNIRAFTKLIRQYDGAVIWSHVVTIPEPNTENGIDASKISGRTIAPLLSPYGMIYADISNGQPVPLHLMCIKHFYSYFASESTEKYNIARSCLAKVIDSNTASSSIYALQTFLQIEAYRKQLSGFEKDPLEAAEISVRHAISLAPQNARAHQAQFGIHKIKGNTKQAIAAATKAMELNPFDSDIAGDFAAFLVSIGEYERAAPLLEKAMFLNPSAPVWLEFFSFLHAEFTQDYESADATASRLNANRSPLAAIAVTLSAYRQGNIPLAKTALTSLLRQEPGFEFDPSAALLRRGFSEQISEKIAKILSAAQNSN